MRLITILSAFLCGALLLSCEQTEDSTESLLIGYLSGSSGSTIITSWQSYAMTISATNVAPTKGTVVVDSAQYRRVGDSMNITYSYHQSAAGSAGNGVYLFNLPSGYSIDTTKVNSGGDGLKGTVGSATAQSGLLGSATGAVLVHDSSYLRVNVGNENAWYTLQHTSYHLADTPLILSFIATVPIVGW